MVLKVFIEINGVQTEVGSITGTNPVDAHFSYSQKYLDNKNASPISISLPLQSEQFSAESTGAFFEGLLPEGFTRHTVAGWLNVDESNYLLLLKFLGLECLGAIKVFDESESKNASDAYEKLTKKDLLSLAQDGALKTAEYLTESRLSLAGATGKTGLMYYNKKWYLPKGSAPSSHIVKQSHVRYNDIVANELLCQKTAEKLGICVPESFIIAPAENNPEYVLFASKRFDRFYANDSRIIDEIPVPLRLHQEDFAQAMGVLALNKYEKKASENYLKRMFEIIRNYSLNPIEDQMLLWDRIVFNYLIGNTDFHIKNSSLIYSPDLKTLRLAPCYDTIATTIYDGTTKNMAFSINGKYAIFDIKKEDFEKAAIDCGLGKAVCLKHFDQMRDNFASALKNSAEELTDLGISNVKDVYTKILKNSKWKGDSVSGKKLATH